MLVVWDTVLQLGETATAEARRMLLQSKAKLEETSHRLRQSEALLAASHRLLEQTAGLAAIPFRFVQR